MEDILTDEEEPQQKPSVNKNMMTKIGFNSEEDSKAKQVVSNKKTNGIECLLYYQKKKLSLPEHCLSILKKMGHSQRVVISLS